MNHCSCPLHDHSTEGPAHAFSGPKSSESPKWGGQQLYIQMGVAWRVSELHQQIVEAIVGNNHADVAGRFGISTQHVYRILSEVRKVRIAGQYPDVSAQIDLF